MRGGPVAALGLLLGLGAGCGTLLASRPAAAPEPILAPAAPGPVPWTGLAPLREAEEFRFVVVTDRTGEHRDGVFESAMPKINLVRPEFVISVGDLIEGYTEEPELLARQWDEIEASVAQLEMPFFYAPGNHDMSNAVMAETWRSRFGPSYYHFLYRGALFVVLNSELFGMVHDPSASLPGPWTQAEQMRWLEALLAEHAAARWTFVFLHQPLWDREPVHADWLRVEELLGSRPYTVFAGHTHRYTKHVRNDRNFITLATTGGGTPLRGTTWGEFDHVAQVSMTARGPVIANLLLDGIRDAEVVTAERRKLVDRLARAVETEPFLGTGEDFRSGTARYTIRNPGSRPIEARGLPGRGRDLEPDARPIEIAVPPRSSARVEVAVRGRSRHPYETLAAAPLRWSLATRDAAGERVEIATESPILPERRFALRRTRVAPTIDGVLDEWGRLAFEVDEPAEIAGPGRHRGPDDASFAFDLRWDDEALYLAVAVHDDSLVVDPERVARHQDHVAVTLDARPDPDRSQNLGTMEAIRSGVMAKLVNALLPLVEPRRDDVLTRFTAAAPAGLRRAVRRTATGYAAELAVPRTLLDERRGGAWDALRVNVTVVDYDLEEPDFVSLAWRPSRFGRRAAPGSGTFERR